MTFDRRCRVLCSTYVLIWSLVVGNPVCAVKAGDLDFVKEIRPIFAARCIECHGPDKQKSSFRVDSRAELVAGGDSGPAIVPGDPDRSHLVERVSTSDRDRRMPPKGDPLSRDQTARIRQWILEGAKTSADETSLDPRRKHWAFLPVTRPAVPRASTAPSGAAVNPIDAFVLAKLASRGLNMSPEADPRAFIRRVTLDLIGLPPTPEDVVAFVRDCDHVRNSSRTLPDAAVERLVDRLLASPRYGEHWAQHWLDVIRYADTDGYESNAVRKCAWPYRDYVIAALNADTPYPRFILEQLAGDTVGIDAATGFLVTPPYPIRDEVGQETEQVAQVRANGLDDVVQNISSAMLGMTIGCARCHDHKFDPVSMRDYYRLVATFAGVQFGERAWRGGNLPVAQRQKAERHLADIQRELSAFPAWREPSPIGTADLFKPIRAKWVRLNIAETRMGRYAPALDELEVWTEARDGKASRNVGGTEAGAVAHSSGSNDERDGKNHLLNDGKTGKDSVWIGKNPVDRAPVWVELELAQTEVIRKVVWNLDSADQGFEASQANHVPLAWRTPTGWSIQVAEHAGQWQTVSPKGHDDDLSKDVAARRNSLEQQFAAAAANLWEWTHVFAGKFQPPEPVHVLIRGDPLRPRELTGPGGIDVLGGYELPPAAREHERRVALARWLGSEKHPLSARVLVNRVWRHHFGAGIVDSPSDFGTQGESPTHSQLLDWLASEFMARGWRLKNLHRLICTSHAFRQSARPDEKAAHLDTGARLLWRFPLRRLEAEAIRDSILFVSGALDFAMRGPPISLYSRAAPDNEWKPEEKPGSDTWRRTIYLLRARGADDGVFSAFDIPDCGQVRPKRSESTTPLQALNLFNSPFVIEQSQLLALRVQHQAGNDRVRQIDRVFELTLARPPAPEERAACLEAVARDGLPGVCRALLNSDEFLFLE